MRTITHLLLLSFLTVLSPTADAQVTNLKIQSSTSTFTFVSGGTLEWEYDLPAAGDTATIEIWIDVNGNGTIEPTTDHLYMAFLQADGLMEGLNGPPDLDGKNSHVYFQAPVGIAPGTYVMKFTSHGAGAQMPGTCTHMPSPAYTVKGKVNVPNGQSAQYIPLELSRKAANSKFWHAVTNANGDYTIEMDADTTGGQWHLKLMANPVAGGVISPEEYWVYPGLNPTGRDFTIQAPIAKVAGIVVDERGSALPDFQVWLNRNDGGVNRSVSAGLDGSYQIGPLGVELNDQPWSVQAGNGDPMSSMTMMAQSQLPALRGGDSLYRRLVIYTINSQIQGQVRINGLPPGMPMQISAWNRDSAQSNAYVDGGTGSFTVGVSNKIQTYQILAINLGNQFNQVQVNAHPGDTGVLLNLTTTSVEEPASAVPRHFALEQNYPNPFNPKTGIRYQVPAVSDVKLEVYNILGQKVATLVNEVKQPGAYTAHFDAANLPSGFYFYRMTAGNFTSTKSMVVLK